MKQVLVSFFVLFLSTAFAAPQFVRWTGGEDSNAEINHVLEVLKVKSGISLSVNDFMLVEDRPLARTHFLMLSQTVARVPVSGLSLRIWTWRKNGKAVQVEANVDQNPVPRNLLAMNRRSLDSNEVFTLVKRAVEKHPDDSRARIIDWKDVWTNGDLLRVVKAKGRRGTHTISISLSTHQITSTQYEEFPQADLLRGVVPAQIYPIYEQVEGTDTLLPRIPGVLKHLQKRIPDATGNPYAPLLVQRYLENKIDPILGLTDEGRAQGYWAPGHVRAQAREILAGLPLKDNTFRTGLNLVGKYASVNLHPEAPSKFSLSFTPTASPEFAPSWRPSAEDENIWEMIPSTPYFGKPLYSRDEAWNRPARRDPNHDPVAYIEDGFDEVQVYWAVNQLFESLRPMGFLDPELSERPFHAFLYDPDISMRDNAYYTDDTINFTTYSKEAQNYARDNTTIWHELGHGVMDRLMGDALRLADTGGLSEGMADFVAQMVLTDVTDGQPFEGKEDMRIFNQTGFYLTNEIHDDGEAYGGAMNDLLVAMFKREGKTGLTKVTDLTLEAMRLARNHPALTATQWFSRMLFADELGNAPLRQPFEMKAQLLAALSGRNFSMEGAEAASFTLNFTDPSGATTELTSSSQGSRNAPIRHDLSATDNVSYKLSAKLKSTAQYAFQYPVTVKVELVKGPLQGAIHWEGEETEKTHTINSESDLALIDLTARGTCDEINRPDGSCVDFAYVQIWNKGASEPSAKKRFYLRIAPKT